MIWILIIFFPLLLSAFVWTTSHSPRGRGALLSGAALPALLAAAGGLPHEPSHQAWLLLGADFGLDSARAMLLLLAALLWGAAGAYSGTYLTGDRKPTRFQFFFLLSMTGTFGLIAAEDAATFYTFFVIMTFASYPLVIHSGSEAARRAGRIYLVMAILGELFLVFALYEAVQAANSLRLEDLGPAVAAAGNGSFIFLLALVGFGVKAGAIPLYFWLPLAHPVAPTPASAVLSGIMIKAGMLGWIHFSPAGSVTLPGWSETLTVLGLLAALGAAAIGFCQTDPKTTLAYSSISQMGLITSLFGLGLNTGWERETLAAGLALFALHHGLAKGALFLGTGVVISTRRHRIPVMAGLALGAIAIAGAPFTGGALAKYALKEAAGDTSGWTAAALPWLLPVSALMTSLLLGRFLWLCWRAKPDTSHGSGAGLAIPWVALLGAMLILPYWANRYFGPGMDPPGLSAGFLLESLLPLLLAAGLLAAGKRWRLGEKRWPAIPPGDLIVPIEGLWRRAFDTLQRTGLPHPARGAIDLVALSDRVLALEEARALMDRTETRLGRWRVVGTGFILIVLALVLLTV
jgi:formate hydrogenlyase subunit 3/multisubunit Na+/H+ antiporter MnhD subunit